MRETTYKDFIYKLYDISSKDNLTSEFVNYLVLKYKSQPYKNNTQEYKELVIKLCNTNLIFINEAHVNLMLPYISQAYNNNKKEYIDYIKSINTSTIYSQISLINYSSTLFILSNYLPNFKKDMSSKDIYNSFIADFELTDKNLNKDLVELNENFAQYVYDYQIGLTKEIKDAIVKTNIATTKDFILENDLANIQDKDGIYNIGIIKVIKKAKYTLIKNAQEPNKLALVIYGYDKVGGAFSQSGTEFKLSTQEKDVLIIDARNKLISINDIKSSLKDSAVSKIDEIYLNMHGANSYFKTDTLLRLNKNGGHIAHNMVLASKLIQIINETINFIEPIKVVIASCYSQLATHKISKYLPIGSQVITLSEYQIVGGEKYKVNVAYLTHKNSIVSEETIKDLAKYHYHSANLNGKTCYSIPSPTYAVLGKCNFITPINLSKTDLDSLWKKINKDLVVNDLVSYINAEKSFIEKVISFFDKSESMYPLLSHFGKNRCNIFEESNNHFHKFLAVSEAIYDLYGQCGKKYIEDTNFKPNEDNFILEAMTDWVLNSPALISNSVVNILEIIIEMI